MSKKVYEESKIQAIADAIREKTGNGNLYNTSEMPNGIDEVYQAGINKGHNEGAISVLENSKYMHPTVSGEVIRIDDMASVPHKATVGKRSKNLLKISDREIISNAWVTNTTPITPNGNQVYIGMSYSNYQQSGTISDVEIGNITSFKSTTLHYGLGFEVKVLPNTTYRISIGEIVNGGIYVSFYDKDGNWLTFGKDTYTFTTTAETEWVVIVLRSNEVNILSSFTDIQLELGTTSTAYTPYVQDLNAVKVYKYGKNLFTTIGRNKADLGANEATAQRNITENSYYVGLLSNNTYYENNIKSYDISDPTSIRINAIANFSGIGFSFRAVPNTTYTVSQSNTTNDKRVRLMFYTQDGTFILSDVGSFQKCTVTAPQNAYWLVVLLCSAVQNTDVYFENVMLEISNTNTEYEPYHKEEIGETFDSTTDIVTLMTDTSGVILDCQYLRDIDKYIDSLNVAVAMTGGA